jgi:hypothetical protein
MARLACGFLTLSVGMEYSFLECGVDLEIRPGRMHFVLVRLLANNLPLFECRVNCPVMVQLGHAERRVR